MKSSNSRVYFAIVIFSALLTLVVLNLPFKSKPFGDDVFHNEAKNLALFITGHVPFSDVLVTRAPGPVLFYAPIYAIAPSDATNDQLWTYAVIFTSIMMTFGLILVFKVSEAFFSREVGILSVFLFFIFPIHCYYSLGITGEGPAFISIAVALYGWSKIWFHPKQKRGWIYFIAGILFLILSRPNTLLIFAIVVMVLGFAYFKRKDFFARFAKPLVISFAIIAVLGAGTLQVAKAISDRPGIARQDDLLLYVLFEGRFQFRDEPFDFRFWDNDNRADSKDYQNWRKTFKSLDQEIINTKSTYKAVFTNFIVNDIKAHPGIFVRQLFIRCVYGNIYIINSITPENFKIGPLKGSFGYVVFLMAVNLVNILILLGLVIFLFKAKDLIAFWPFWGIILALFLFHGLTYMEPRYIFPSKVAINILGAAGLYKLGWIKKGIDKIAVFFFPQKAHHS